MTGRGAERRLVRGERGRAQSLRQTKAPKVKSAEDSRGQGMRGRPDSPAMTQIVGNLTSEPKLLYTATGAAKARFTVASNDRRFNPILGQWRDTPTMFTHCIVKGAQAEHVAVTLHRGHRVVVLGRLRTSSSDTRGSRKGTTLEFDVSEVALSLRYTGAAVGAS